MDQKSEFLLEESEVSNLSSANSDNLKKIKQCFREHFKNKKIQTKMDFWIEELKKMPDSSKKNLENFDINLLNQQKDLVLKETCDKIKEDIFYLF